MMRKLLLALMCGSLAYAAGTVAQNSQAIGTSGSYVVTFTWTGDSSSGSVPATAAILPGLVQGYRIIAAEVAPGSPAPTNNYTVTLTDFAGVDLLAGGGGGMSSTTASSIAASPSAPPIFGTFTLNVTGNSVASAKGTVIVYLSPLSQVYGLTPTAPSFASQGPNLFLASPNGASGAPAFRSMLAADLPASFNAPTATALQGTPTLCTAGQAPTGINASGNAQGCTTYAPVTADINSSGQVIHGNHITDGSIPNAGLANPSTTVNGTTCTLGSTCTIAAGGSSVFASPSSYTFSQTPGGSLTGGALATVTLTPCPSGVNGADTNHYLYVSGGTGTAEAVLISGGTCTSGAGSGTVTFTPTNSHSGAWTLSSATGGIQEAAVALPTTVIYLPQSGINIYAKITLPTAHPGIIGAGFRSQILVNFTTGDILDTGEGIYENFWIVPQAPMTSGVMLNCTSNVYCFVHEVHLGTNTNPAYIGYSVLNSTSFIDATVIVADFHGIEILGNGTANPQFISNTRILTSKTNTTYLANSARVYAKNCSYIYLDNVMFSEGVSDYGIEADTSDTNAVSYVTITNSLIANYGEFGIRNLTGGTAAHWKISNTQVLSNSGSAASMYNFEIDAGASDWSIANCTAAFTTMGIHIVSASYINVNGCHVYPTAGIVTGNGVGISGTGSPTHITFNGGEIGTGPDGGPAAYGIQDGNASTDYLSISNVVLTGSTAPLSLTGTETHVMVVDNLGVDNVSGTVADAASVAFPVNSYFTLTGTGTGITAVTGIWPGRRGTFVATNAAPPAFTAGATIGNSFTPTQNVPVNYTVDGAGKIWMH